MYEMKKIISILFSLVVACLFPIATYAEVKVVEAESTYIMGDNDSKVEARRIAMQEAQRKALELAGTYVESLTQVKNYKLTKDEIRSYTAGVLETEVESEQMLGTTEHPEIYIKTRCKIDTDILIAQIDKFQENEDLKEQVNVTAKENDDLKKERDELVKQLASEKNKAQAAETRQKLDSVLSQEEANDQTHKVWINIGSQLVHVDENDKQINQADLDTSFKILQRAVNINPQNQRARLMLAAIYQKRGNVAAAEDELRVAVQRNPTGPIPHIKLGVLLKDEGKYQEALQQFHIVERMRPHNPEMLFYTGMTFKQMNRCHMSVQYLNRFLKDPRAKNYPWKKQKAMQTIRECRGGGLGLLNWKPQILAVGSSVWN
jgi:tetratricopeptide (TPR) repeat protein